MKPLIWIACIGIAGVAALFVERMSEARKGIHAVSWVNALEVSLRAYHQEYGALPSGDQAAVIRVLCGDNERHIFFLDDARFSRDESGRILDPWGSPYRIDTSDPMNPRVHSPGEDKKDEPDRAGSDDVRSWNLSGH